MKLYVPVVTLSTQDNVKLLKPLRVRFDRKINWNKYQSKLKRWAHNQYLNYLFGPNFQGVDFLCYHMKMKQTQVVTQDIIFQK